jgi:TRAF3-interacting protein 1
MTEKLLTRPPFRYIHDIISATIEKTGWGAGLFIGEEANSKGIEDKDQKIFILQKVLDLTQMCLQEEIDVRPIKIVAGQECENTNLFLQKVYQAAVMGIDTTDAV